MRIDCMPHGLAEAAVVRVADARASDIVNDARPLLYTRLKHGDDDSFCLRDYASGLEFRGKTAGRTIAAVEATLVVVSGVNLIGDAVDTEVGISAWTKYLANKSVVPNNAPAFPPLKRRGYWRRLKVRRQR